MQVDCVEEQLGGVHTLQCLVRAHIVCDKGHIWDVADKSIVVLSQLDKLFNEDWGLLFVLFFLCCYVCAHANHEIFCEGILTNVEAVCLLTSCLKVLILLTYALLTFTELFIAWAARAAACLWADTNSQLEITVWAVGLHRKDHLLFFLHDNGHSCLIRRLLACRNVIESHFIIFHHSEVFAKLSDDLPRRMQILLLLLILLDSYKLGWWEKYDENLLDLPAQIVNQHLELVLRIVINHILLLYLSLIQPFECNRSSQCQCNRILNVAILNKEFILISILVSTFLLLITFHIVLVRPASLLDFLRRTSCDLLSRFLIAIHSRSWGTVTLCSTELESELLHVDAILVGLELHKGVRAELRVVHPALGVLLDQPRDQVATDVRHDYPRRQSVRTLPNFRE